ncbi:MAG: polysaccharide deacetylase family protein [Solirubrobacteraceae bacterium]
MTLSLANPWDTLCDTLRTVQGPAPPQSRLLSIDFEDWHQLVRRRVGAADWETGGTALERQTGALLELLQELGARATFFVLGVSAQAHPRLVERIVAGGHEVASHGHSHTPVHAQSPGEFERDLRQARHVIQELTGVTPVGYRAPAFSITTDSTWAYDVLAAEGFAYDSSQHDSPRLHNRIRTQNGAPYRMELPTATLWEFPVAVWRTPVGPVPVGGPSYWAVMPTRLVLHGLAQAGPLAGLYLHPQELDPEHLRAELPDGTSRRQRAHGAFRSAQRNLARRRTATILRAIARQHLLIPYGEAHAGLAHGAPAST